MRGRRKWWRRQKTIAEEGKKQNKNKKNKNKNKSLFFWTSRVSFPRLVLCCGGFVRGCCHRLQEEEEEEVKGYKSVILGERKAWRKKEGKKERKRECRKTWKSWEIGRLGRMCARKMVPNALAALVLFLSQTSSLCCFFPLVFLISRGGSWCASGWHAEELGCFVVNAVMACQAIANIVKSSLGPVGLDKVRIVEFFFITESCSLSFCFVVAPCNKSLYKLGFRGFFAVKEILRPRETPFILATTIATWKQLSFAGHNAWMPIRFSCQRRICLSL